MLDGKAGKFSRATYNNKRLEIHNVLFLCEESTNFVQQAQFLSIQSVMIVQTGAVYWSSQSILLILYMFNLPQEYELQSIHCTPLQNNLLLPESRLNKSRIEIPSQKSLTT